MYYYDENGKPIPPSPVPVKGTRHQHVPMQDPPVWMFLLIPIMGLTALVMVMLSSEVHHWEDRGCSFSHSVVLSITRGEPGIFDYCPVRK